MSAAAPRRQIWGRRHGHRLRPGRRQLLETRLPELAIALPAVGRLEPRALFATSPREVWLEIGFGGGEHLAEQALRHPEIGFLGVEPFVDGVARLLALLEQGGLDNVRILMDDARLLLRALADASIGRVFILFPDPWPKPRHHKRRIVNPETVAELSRVMAPGGELRLATDDADYAWAMLEAVMRHGSFARLAEGSADWPARPADWPATRYEAKALAAGRRCTYLRLRRDGGPLPAGVTEGYCGTASCIVLQGAKPMRKVSVREMRALLPELETTLAQEGELLLTRHGKPIARLMAAAQGRPHRPSHADLRATMPYQEVPSEVLIRQDRDER